MEKISFRAKVFVLFIIYTILFKFTVDLIAGHKFAFSIMMILRYIIYSLTIYFLIKNKFWAWLIAPLPWLWTLFNPTSIVGGVPAGIIFRMALAYTRQDIITIAILLMGTVVPIFVFIYSITNLVIDFTKTDNRKFDLLFGAIFVFITAVGFSNIIAAMITKRSITVPGVIIAVLYVVSALIWQKGYFLSKSNSKK